MSDRDLQLPALDPARIKPRTVSVYPPPHDLVTQGRSKRSLTEILGLTQFGVNVTEIAPGSASALRHWHTHEDEFVFIISGRPTLYTNEGEQQLEPGMTAGFPAGKENGHRLVNKTGDTVVILEVGSRSDLDECIYPDEQLKCRSGRYDGAEFVEIGPGDN